MMINKIPKITVFICIAMIMSLMIGTYEIWCEQHNGVACFCDNVTSRDTVRGYNPESDAPKSEKNEWGLPVLTRESGEHENRQYLKWCEETFDNGSDIYEAYKKIAFNIEYVPEEKKTDFWQTPSETARIRKGDCEDAVLLFFSKISPQQKGAEIVWGWVFNRETMVGRAHVWYQVKDKNGLSYVVEGFSKDWNGIIPEAVLELNEIRKPIFVIDHATISHLVNSLKKAATLQRRMPGKGYVVETSFGGRGETGQPVSQEWADLFSLPDNDLFERVINMQHKSRISTRLQSFFHERNLALNMKEISNILTKLHEVLTRHLNQSNAAGAQPRAITRRDETNLFCVNRSSTCRR